MARRFIVAAESFDIYDAGNLVANFPWYITDATRRGQISLSAGAFGQGALTFPTSGLTSALQSGFEYEFKSSVRMVRGNMNPGGRGAISISLWCNVSQLAQVTGPLLQLGSSLAPGLSYTMLSVSNTATGGSSFQFPLNLNNPTSNPFSFALQPSTYYWLQMKFAYGYDTSGNAVLTGSFSVNGSELLSNQPIAWASDVFSTNQIINRLKFTASSSINYFVDDLIVQTTSDADSDWSLPVGVNPTTDLLPTFPQRRIYAGTAIANGSVTEWTASNGLPNYQAATDRTGTNYVSAEQTGLTDTYKWNYPAMNDISGVVMRGNANRYQNVVGSFKTSPTSAVTKMGSTGSNPNEYISVAENDGASDWTTSSILAGEFGQTTQ